MTALNKDTHNCVGLLKKDTHNYWGRNILKTRENGPDILNKDTHYYRPRQAGVTLVELLVSIVIVAIAATTILGVLAATTGSSADPMIRHQASAVAEAYLEEILLKSFDDPDGSDGEGARAAFDDLDDYNGLVDAGARDQFGNAIAGLDAYTVSVAVTPSAALPGVPAGDAFRIDVNVSRGSDINLLLSGYRTRL